MPGLWLMQTPCLQNNLYLVAVAGQVQSALQLLQEGAVCCTGSHEHAAVVLQSSIGC